MKRSTKVTIALGGAALVGAVFSRRRVAPKAPPVQRTILALSAVVLAQWWNPTTWWGTVTSLSSAAVNDIKNWVRDAIQKAIALYDAGLQFVLGLIDDLLNAITAALSALETQIVRGATELANVVLTTIPNAIDALATIASGWVHDAENALSAIIAAVQGWASQIFGELENAATTVLNDYVLPAWHWIAASTDWLVGNLANWAKDIESWAVGLFGVLITDLEHGLAEVVDLVGHEVLDAVHIVEKAWDWLVWFGENPIGAIEGEVLDVLSHIDHAFINAVVAGVGSDSGSIERTFEQILGD